MNWIMDYQCDGRHAVCNCEQVAVKLSDGQTGHLYLEVCCDPKCAHIKTTCQHSKCTWNKAGTVLLCDVCGVDGT